MKRKSLKTLKLNKSKVSNLIDAQLRGGISGSTELTALACTLRCGGNTGPKPSGNPDCEKK
ncbi:hypothetical protein [uncultured Kordia sp.]|uniref:hypothetical protein n=1 Tax=uncultured Kordia sp. TaxID=507699 RepID=UPI002626EA44|nr:hypothetical protein [uncultured Kordia sp.]